MSAPGQRRTKAAKKRDEDIFAAALDLFLRKGISETRVEEILAASGASVGSFYYRYESKIDLATSLYLSILEGFYADCLADLRRAKGARGRVESLVRSYFRWVRDSPDECAFEYFGRTTEVVFASQPQERMARGAFVETVVAMLEPSIEAGEIKRLSPDLYLPLWLGPAEMLVQFTITRQGYSVQASRRELVAILRDSERLVLEAAWEALRV